MKYLKRFQTNAQFLEYFASNDYVEPNVSYIKIGSIVMYNKKPTMLRFIAEQANSTVSFNRIGNDSNLSNAVLQYSTDDETWHNYTLNTQIELTNIGDYVMFKGTNTTFGFDTSYHQFVMSGKIRALGDITSLNNGRGGNFEISASYCYQNMFKDCTSLITPPALPATTLNYQCYYDMFSGCTSLTTAPELPATTLANNCYIGMFRDCTSLTTAPALPATTLTYQCYSGMFSGCTSLTTAPELQATTLANYCYFQMFKGCTKLNYIKAMFTTTPGISYTTDWVYGVAETGTFVKNRDAQWNVTGDSGIPNGWRVETAAA